MKRRPRKTLLLALIATLGLLGVIVATLSRNDETGEVRTSTVHEMVASLDDNFQRVAFETASPGTHVGRPGSLRSGVFVLGLLAVWGLYRWRSKPQQQSRSKRS